MSRAEFSRVTTRLSDTRYGGKSGDVVDALCSITLGAGWRATILSVT
mgnify:CR=1 FL=1